MQNPAVVLQVRPDFTFNMLAAAITHAQPSPALNRQRARRKPCMSEARQAQLQRSVQAPPGAGKSTGLPVALLEEEPAWLQGRKIVLLQPRRVAVYAVARRIAWLLGERVGDRVGMIRFDVTNCAVLMVGSYGLKCDGIIIVMCTHGVWVSMRTCAAANRHTQVCRTSTCCCTQAL